LKFREKLLRARPLAPHSQWLVDLAVAVSDATRPPEIAEHLDLMDIIRQALAPIRRPAIKLGRYDYSRRSELDRERSLISSIYRTRRTEAALRHLAAHPLRDMLLPERTPRSAGLLWAWAMELPFSMEDLMAWKRCSHCSDAHSADATRFSL
jgi:plasmid stability protein